MFTVVTRVKDLKDPLLSSCVESVSIANTVNMKHEIVHIPESYNFIESTYQCKNLGKYIAFVDSDDIITEESLTLCYNAIRNNNLDAVFTDEILINLSDKKQSYGRLGKRSYIDVTQSPMAAHHIVFLNTGLIDENVLELAIENNCGIEWLMTCSVILRGKVAHIPKVCYHWYKYPGQHSRITSNIYSKRRESLINGIKKTWNIPEGFIEQLK